MDNRFLFIGDSFVNGTGDPEALGWVGRVCAATQASGAQLTFYNLGIRGDTTTLIAQRWQQEVTSRLPPGSRVGFIFSFGANDVNIIEGHQRVEQSESLDNAKAILTAAQAMGPVLMIGSPPIADDPSANRRLEALWLGIESLCHGRNIPCIPTLETLVNTPGWMEEAIANDGAHPGAMGYQALANLVMESQTWKNWISPFLMT